MPRKSLGPRIYFDSSRESYVIRHGRRFIRTGARGWRAAEEKLLDYLKSLAPVEFIPATKPTPGFVYFISAETPDFPVKIGFTERLNNVRIGGLQTGCPYPLVMLASVPGTYQDERALHRQFDEHRLCGEWFVRTPELLAVIEQHAWRAA